MLYNAQRRRVHEWKPGEPSTCPDCRAALLARRGEFIIWHWAHHPRSRRGAGCFHQETEWHLAWKAAYAEFRNWCVEQPLHGFRVDAANVQSGEVREFIHSLTPRYIEKHRALSERSFQVRWIIDGEAFGSKRKRRVARGGIKRLLTPRTYQLHVALGRRCWVHWEGQLWKEWGDHDVWFPRVDDSCRAVLSAFERAMKVAA